MAKSALIKFIVEMSQYLTKYDSTSRDNSFVPPATKQPQSFFAFLFVYPELRLESRTLEL